MNWQTVLAIVAIVISAIAAWYARVATSEAKKGNELSRLNALVVLRSHYSELARYAADNVEALRGTSAQKFAQSELESLNQKLHEVTHEIAEYHGSLVHRRA